MISGVMNDEISASINFRLKYSRIENIFGLFGAIFYNITVFTVFMIRKRPFPFPIYIYLYIHVFLTVIFRTTAEGDYIFLAKDEVRHTKSAKRSVLVVQNDNIAVLLKLQLTI